MKHGFSLVELSIVLVILGLLVGGIMTGQNLIHAAQLRSVSKDLEQYAAAIHLFRDKYFDLPGEMTNAKKFWGEAASGTACKSTIGIGTQTCNGDGDGTITHNYNADSNERLRAWQHLANAGLITGNYSGVAIGGDEQHGTPGENIPGSKMSNMGYVLFGSLGWTDTNHYYPDTMERLDTQMHTTGSLLTPEDQWNIDVKIDDGKPGTGRLYSLLSTSTWGPDCSTTDDADTAEYELSNPDRACLLHFTF